MTVKAIFFDAAGTLFQPVRSVGQSYAACAARHGVEVSPADLAKRFRTCFADAPQLAFPGAAAGAVTALEREWWKSVVMHVFEPSDRFKNFDHFFDELFTYFADPKVWVLYSEVLRTLTALKERGLQLSVISNFDSRLVPILEGLGTGAFFERVFVSSRIGYAKPDARIFHAALDHHRLKPAEAMHVGDSEVHDLQGANNAGLRGILVDRDAPADPSVGDRIASLEPLLDFVD